MAVSLSPNGNSYVRLKTPGIDLIAHYCADKYAMPIPKRWDSPGDFAVHCLVLHEECKFLKDEIRIPFIISSLLKVPFVEDVNLHSTPAVYLKQGDTEFILYLDSLGDEKGAHEIADGTDIPVLYLPMRRQIDLYSCHTDALVFLRELVGRSQNGEFLIPDLLQKLENILDELQIILPSSSESSEQKSNPTIHKKAIPIKLRGIDRLLMTAQDKDFVAQQKEGSQTVHNYENQAEVLDAFFNRYLPRNKTTGTLFASAFLQQKGFKYAHMIEIQFYLEQLEKLLPFKLSKSKKKDFIVEAKRILEKQAVEKYTPESCPGLYQFTRDFASELGIKLTAEPEGIKSNENVGRTDMTAKSEIGSTSQKSEVEASHVTMPKTKVGGGLELPKMKVVQHHPLSTKSVEIGDDPLSKILNEPTFKK